MRYENKIVFNQALYAEIYQKILSSPYFFTEIFHERQINNIYLDTEIYKNYYDNLTGVQNRTKHRIRWYGDTTIIDNPILEYKIKNGPLGYKKYFPLLPFTLNTEFNYYSYLSDIKNNLPSSHKNNIMFHEISMEAPTLFNTYIRRYFISGDEKFRITIDKNLVYHNIQQSFSNDFAFYDDNIVVELKYENEDILGAQKLLQDWGFRLFRNSKYVTGMNGLLFQSFVN